MELFLVVFAVPTNETIFFVDSIPHLSAHFIADDAVNVAAALLDLLKQLLDCRVFYQGVVLNYQI